MPETVTIPHLSEALGETKTYNAPAAWHERIKALAPFCVYGENYRRGTIEALDDMSRNVGWGEIERGENYLLLAERRAA